MDDQQSATVRASEHQWHLSAGDVDHVAGEKTENVMESNVGVDNNGGYSLEELRTRARRHVEEYLETMPEEETAAYREAVDKVPDIVSTETDPLNFLRRDDYNIPAAAKRLALYWTERKKSFGPERAFLPLVITGKGALSKLDIMEMKAGFPSILPRTKDGQPVVYYDRRQIIQTSDADTRNRSALYVVNLFVNEDIVQEKGLKAIILLATPRLGPFDREAVKRSFLLASRIYPLKVDVHVVNFLPKDVSKRYEVQDLVQSYASLMIECGYDPEKVTIHFERTEGQILQELQEAGLSKEGIPKDLGGTWSFQCSPKWCREQAAIDRKLYGRIIARIQREHKKSLDGAGQDGIPKKEKDDSDQTKAEKLSKLRAINAIHARRKRDRRKQNFLNLQNECINLEKEKESLEHENIRLLTLLETARLVTGTHDDDDASQDKKPAASKNFKS